jgi:hypothetical protein
MQRIRRRLREPTATATEDRFLTRREELENKTALLHGGRAAEYRYSEETTKEIDRAEREISGRAFVNAVLIQEATPDGRLEPYSPAMRTPNPAAQDSEGYVACVISPTSARLPLQGKNVPGHFPGVGLGYFGIGWHMPRPAAMDAFSDRGGENRHGLRVAPVPCGDVGVRRTRFGFIVGVADIVLVLLQQDLRNLGLGNVD